MERFEVERTASAIRERGSSHVALQFSRSLLAEAPLVVWELEKLVDAELYVLGDEMRCGAVDAIGAAHVDAELVVHYGADCLQPPPDDCSVLYVVAESRDLDARAAAKELSAALGDDATRVALLYDPAYAEATRAMSLHLLPSTNVEIVTAELPAHVTGKRTEVSLVVCGLEFPDADEEWFRSSRVVYVGSDNTEEMMLRCSACVDFVVFDGQKCARPSATRTLTRRQHALQRAAMATRWGIVVADAGRLKDSTAVADACENELKEAERAAYLLAVGAPTVTKLANFAEIEAFVVVGADSSLLQHLSAESPVPVVSVHEMRVALGSLQWLPDDTALPFYTTSLQDAATASLRRKSETEEEEEEPRFLTTTTVEELDVNRRRLLLEYSDGPLMVAEQQSQAIDFLRKREYRGLDPRIGETPVEAASQGDDGIASAYAHERRPPSSSS